MDPTLPMGVAPLLFAALLWSSDARCDLPGDTTHALPCRPTIACTADIVEVGAFELEAGYLYRKLNAQTAEVSLPWLAKQTVLPWLQLQVGSNGYSAILGAPSYRYQDDVTFGAKARLFEQTTVRPSIAVSGALSVPTSEQAGYLRTDDALFIGYVTKDLGALHVDLNVGLNAWRIERSPIGQRWIALALSTQLTPLFGLMAEGYTFSNALPVTGRDAGGLFAVTVSPRPWLVFDFGGDVGLEQASRKWSAFFGMTIVPVILGRAEHADAMGAQTPPPALAQR